MLRREAQHDTDAMRREMQHEAETMQREVGTLQSALHQGQLDVEASKHQVGVVDFGHGSLGSAAIGTAGHSPCGEVASTMLEPWPYHRLQGGKRIFAAYGI